MSVIVKSARSSLVKLSLLTLGSSGKSYGLSLSRADNTLLGGPSSLFKLTTSACGTYQRYQFQLTTGFRPSWLSVATLRLDSGRNYPKRSIAVYGSYLVNSASLLECQGLFQSKSNKKLVVFSVTFSINQAAIGVTQSFSRDPFDSRPDILTAFFRGRSSTAINISYSPRCFPSLKGNL